MYLNSFEWDLDGLVDINILNKINPVTSYDLFHGCDEYNMEYIIYYIIGNLCYSTEKYTRLKLLTNEFEFTTSREIYEKTGIIAIKFKLNESNYRDMDSKFKKLSVSYFNILDISEIELIGDIKMINLLAESIRVLNLLHKNHNIKMNISLYLIEPFELKRDESEKLNDFVNNNKLEDECEELNKNLLTLIDECEESNNNLLYLSYNKNHLLFNTNYEDINYFHLTELCRPYIYCENIYNIISKSNYIISYREIENLVKLLYEGNKNNITYPYILINDLYSVSYQYKQNKINNKSYSILKSYFNTIYLLCDFSINEFILHSLNNKIDIKSFCDFLNTYNIKIM